jgi:hypothetical protein
MSTNTGIMQLRVDTPVEGLASRWGPLVRMGIAGGVAGVTSVVFHVVTALVLGAYVRSRSGTYGGEEGIFLAAVLLALLSMGVLLAVLKVQRPGQVWALGCVLALPAVWVSAFDLNRADAGSVATRLGAPGLASFVVGDSLALALVFALAALPTDPRLARWLRFDVPMAVLGAASLWGVFYLLFYRT